MTEEDRLTRVEEDVKDLEKKVDELRITTAKRGGVFAAVLFALTVALGALGGYMGALFGNGR